MIRTPAILLPERLPVSLRGFLEDATVFDSSCSRTAQVYFLDKGPGFYLKTAAAGALRREAELAAYFCGKGLGAPVLAYESGERDWMLTRRVPGEDCTHPMYMEDPLRLCDTTAQLLRRLHEIDPADCPVTDRTGEYLETARRNYEEKRFDASLFPDNWGYSDPEEAWSVVQRQGAFLRRDTLLHGDYCLPNILLDGWRFSGLIDLGNGGVGDRHMDLFWGIWSLGFNLKTDRYRERFLDAYGRDKVEEELLRTVAAVEVFG